MPKHLIAFFMLAFLVGSCAPVSPLPPTATVTPTITPSLAPSATPTAVPQTNEHLIVTRDREHWAVLNADGSLQKYIQIRDLAWPSDISSDGNWVPYEPGSYENEPYDYSLNLLNLEDGTSQFVVKLLSPDFPKNIEPIVKSTFQYDPSLYGADCADMRCRRSHVKDEVAISAGISEWSPDGQLIAFAAQIDGPSTDIYIYSMQDKTIRRLTDDLQNVGRVLEWSPDGKRLLYTNVIPGTDFGNFDRETFHVTDLGGKNLQLSQEILINTVWGYMRGWIANNLYLIQVNSLDNPPKSSQLIVLNTENGEVTEIWPYPTHEIAIDTDNKRIILSFHQPHFTDPIPNAPEPGIYFVSTNGERKKISNHVFSPLLSSSEVIGSSTSQIIGTEEGVAYHILSDGSIKQIGPTDSGWHNSSSPDKKWFFLAKEELADHYRLSLYGETCQRIKSWMLDGDLWDTTWRPDSLGIFLFTDDNIYYLAIPDGEPQLLNVEVPPCSWDPVACKLPSFAWRP